MARTIWFAEAYIPILDETGKPYKVINIVNDITRFMEEKINNCKLYNYEKNNIIEFIHNNIIID